MPGEPLQPGEKKATPSPWGFALGAGSELVASVLLGFFVGQWLDGRFGTGPWLMLAGALGGITLGLYTLIRATQKRLDGGKKRG